MKRLEHRIRGASCLSGIILGEMATCIDSNLAWAVGRRLSRQIFITEQAGQWWGQLGGSRKKADCKFKTPMRHRRY